MHTQEKLLLVKYFHRIIGVSQCLTPCIQMVTVLEAMGMPKDVQDAFQKEKVSMCVPGIRKRHGY